VIRSWLPDRRRAGRHARHVEAVASAQVNGYDVKIVKVQAEFCAALAES
jgi:hypothetical protein